MKLLLASQADMDLKPLALACSQHGHTISRLVLEPGVRSKDRIRGLDLAVLVLRQQGVVPLGERIEELRSRLAADVELVLCAPAQSASDRETLADSGADDIVTPRGWSPGEVAERVLGKLIEVGGSEKSAFGAFRGGTWPMREVYRSIEKLAPLAEPILILGETGTGKELVAQELHRRSGRQGKLVSINVAEISPELLGSDLFGHEKGSFTSAAARPRGLLAEAGDGTAFLDEIGDLDPASQAKLLRVIEDRKVRLIGSNEWHDIGACLVFATNRDLEKACREKKFRQDLYERLRGFTLHLPPLRQRRSDIPLLVAHFVREYNEDYKDKGFRLSVPAGAVDPLFRHDWPGNVRELRQAVRQAAAYADETAGPISVVHLHESILSREPVRPDGSIPVDLVRDTWKAVQERAKRIYFRGLFDEVPDMAAAAKRSGIGKSQLYEIRNELEKKP